MIGIKEYERIGFLGLLGFVFLANWVQEEKKNRASESIREKSYNDLVQRLCVENRDSLKEINTSITDLVQVINKLIVEQERNNDVVREIIHK